MFRLIKTIFIEFLSSIVNFFNHTKCVSLSNQKCMIQPTLIKLHPNEYNQEFLYNLFSVTLDRYVGSCNTLTECFQHDCRHKWIGNINKIYFTWV